jgi:hypothetical protein
VLLLKELFYSLVQVPNMGNKRLTECYMKL